MHLDFAWSQWERMPACYCIQRNQKKVDSTRGRALEFVHYTLTLHPVCAPSISSMFPLATSGTGFLIWNRNKMNFSWKENSFYLQLQTIIIKTIVWHLGGFNSWHVTPSHSNHMVAMISTATQTHLFQPQWTKISRCNKACNSCSWRASFKGTLSAFSCFLSCIHCCSLWCY